MHLNLYQLIRLEHNIAWKSDSLQSIEEVEIICLTEQHNKSAQLIQNATLVNNINHFGKFNDQDLLILMELDREFEFSDRENMKKWPSTELIEKPTLCKGWDARPEYFKTICRFKYLVNCSANDIPKLISILKTIYPLESRLINNENYNKYVSKLNEEYKDNIFNSFQARNQGLIETLEKTKNMAKIRFVFGGRAHFLALEEQGQEKCGAYHDGRLSLKPLHMYLNDKKAIILTPK